MTTMELDSHANTCVLGRDCLVTLDYNQPVQVVGYDGHVFDQSALRGQPKTLVINSLVSTTQTAADVSSDDNFVCLLSLNTMISSVDANLTGHTTTKAKAPIVFRTLADRWIISPQQAQKTITVTTQQGVR